MGAADQYVRQIWKQKKWIAMAPPGQPLSLGEVWMMKHGVPRYMTSLKKLGIKFGVKRGASEDVWTCQSKTGVAVTAKLKGQVPGGVTLNVLTIDDLGAVVRIRDESSFVMSLSQVAFDHMDDLPALGSHLRSAFLKNRWDTSWLIVSELATAQSGTFLSTAESGAQYELMAAGGVTAGPVTVADLSAGWKLVSSAESSETFVARGRVTPLFRAHRWGLLGGVKPSKPGWFYASDEGEDLPESEFSEFDPTADE